MGFEASASAHIGVIVSLDCVHKKLSADNNAAKDVSEFDCDEVEELGDDLRKFIAPICEKHGVKLSVTELHATVEDAEAESAILIGPSFVACCSASGRENYGSDYDSKAIPIKVVSDKEEEALKEILSALEVPFTELPLRMVAEVSTG